MPITDQIYDSMCNAVQILIDIMDKKSLNLTEEQFEELLLKIGKINDSMEEYSKRYKNTSNNRNIADDEFWTRHLKNNNK